MSDERWLPLTDYANKYKVSVSTLRRRIKNSQVEFTYVEGKYLLKDSPLDNQTLVNDRAQLPNALTSISQNGLKSWNRVTNAPPHNVSGHSATPVLDPGPLPREEKPTANSTESPVSDDQTVQALLAEVKRAYSLVLQEKEEVIIMLKEEVTDLRTLVRVLESENERLKTNARESSPIDKWLNEIDALEK